MGMYGEYCLSYFYNEIHVVLGPSLNYREAHFPFSLWNVIRNSFRSLCLLPSLPSPLPLAFPSFPSSTSDGRVVLHPSNGIPAFCTFAYFFPPKLHVGKNSLRSTFQYCAFFAFFLPSGSAQLSSILKAKFGYIIGRRRRKFESDYFRTTKEDQISFFIRTTWYSGILSGIFRGKTFFAALCFEICV